jgi:hypothetical protein
MNVLLWREAPSAHEASMQKLLGFAFCLLLVPAYCASSAQIIRQLANEPFTATRTQTTTFPDKVSTTVGLIARRSDGSTYTEMRSPNGQTAQATAGHIIIIDVTKHRTIELYPTPHLYKLTEDPNLKATVWPPEYATMALRDPQPAGTKREADNVEYTSLGTRDLQGITLIGTSTLMSSNYPDEKFRGYSSEKWRSPVLDIDVESRTHQLNPEIIGVTTFTGIHVGEPDPNLFEIPAGYTEDTYLKNKRAPAVAPAN